MSLNEITEPPEYYSKGEISKSPRNNSLVIPEVHGHRGARGHYPENTLPAFKYALEAGVDFLELDLGITNDGAVIINHDPWILPDRCTHGDGSPLDQALLIRDQTLAEIKKFDCGRKQNPHFPQQRSVPGTTMPTLAELFDLVRNSKHPNASNVRFNIETKIFPDHPELTVGPEEFTERVINVVIDYGFADRVLLQSFDPRTLILAKATTKHSRIQTSLLVEDPNVDLLEAALKYEVNTVSPNFLLLNLSITRELQQNGFKVVPWTLNSTSDWKQSLEYAVDGIITDYPEELLCLVRPSSE